MDRLLSIGTVIIERAKVHCGQQVETSLLLDSSMAHLYGDVKFVIQGNGEVLRYDLTVSILKYLRPHRLVVDKPP